MEAEIRIGTVRKEFRQDQLAIMKRIAQVLVAHDLTVEIVIEQKEVEKQRFTLLKAV